MTRSASATTFRGFESRAASTLAWALTLYAPHARAQFGEIVDIYLPKDRETGKLRGFGFVSFKDALDAQDASKEMHR